MVQVARGVSGLSLSWLLVMAAAFLLLRAMPGDPALIFANASGLGAPAALIAEIRAQWGLDQTLPAQFLRWLGGFLTGDWGLSYATGRPVFDEIVRRLPWSVAIGCGGLAAAVVVGFGLGFRAALYPGGLADRFTRVLAIGGQALPAFAVGFLLLWLFTIEWRLVSPLSGGVAERLVLPIVLVALFSVGAMARIARIAFREMAVTPHVRTARAKGLSRAGALWLHGRRHAGLSTLAALTPELGWAIGGTAIAEMVFSIPGLSEYVVGAVAARDYAVLQAFVAIVALWILCIQRAAAFARFRLDPRLETCLPRGYGSR